jgi:predicted permease
VFTLLIVCLLLGALVARLFQPPAALAIGLNWWVLNIALPALVLHLTAQLHLSIDMWFLIVSMWLIFVGSWALFAALGVAFNWSRARVGALTLVCGLGNTSFVGYPMIEALRGSEGLALAVVADQAGCFVMLAVGGAIVSSIYSGGSASAIHILKRVLLFPAFIALLIGLSVGLLGGWPTFVASTLERVGGTLVPIALFSVGMQVRFSFPSEQFVPASFGLIYKLALAPLAIYALGMAAGIEGMTLTIGVLQSSMAPMISAAILAEQHDLEPRLANMVLTVGIALSFITVPLIDSWL